MAPGHTKTAAASTSPQKKKTAAAPAPVAATRPAKPRLDITPAKARNDAGARRPRRRLQPPQVRVKTNPWIIGNNQQIAKPNPRTQEAFNAHTHAFYTLEPYVSSGILPRANVTAGTFRCPRVSAPPSRLISSRWPRIRAGILLKKERRP